MSKPRRTAQAREAERAAAREPGSDPRRTKSAVGSGGRGGAGPKARTGSAGARSTPGRSPAARQAPPVAADVEGGPESMLGLYREVADSIAEAVDLPLALAGVVECFCRHVPLAVGYGIVDPGVQPRKEVWWAAEEERYDQLREVLGSLRPRVPGADEGDPPATEAAASIVGRVLDSGLPVIIERLEDETLEDASLASEAGLGAAHAFPVFFGSEVVAVVVFFTPEPGALGESLIDAIQFSLRQLEVVAGTEKAERAVKAAARHARAQAAELNEMAVRLQASGAQGGDGMYDALSGFPRRRLLLDRLQQTLRRRQRNPDLQFAVACLGIEGLREVRDRLGLRASEECLLALCRRMETALRPADTIARTGDDEFTIILEDCEGLEEANAAAERIQAAIRRPFLLDGEETATTASIGLTLGGPAYEYAETILRDAMAALRASRAFGDEQPRVFDLAEQPRAVGARLQEDDLARALREGELALEYQPVVSLRSGRVAGFEARARWMHPVRGPLAPEQFLPESGAGPAVSALLAWSIREACSQTLEWHRYRPASAPYAAVTLSPEQFYSPDLVTETWDVLTSTDLDGRQLRFVVGEGVLARSPGQAAQVLASLGALEVGVVMDGFGTGYSSLPNLHRLRPRGLIIDRAFLAGTSRRPSQWLVARTIVELARIIDAEPIAAGIETEAQLARLFELGCLRAQGPYFGGGLPGDRTRALLEEGFGAEVRALQRPGAGGGGQSPFTRFLEGRG